MALLVLDFLSQNYKIYLKIVCNWRIIFKISTFYLYFLAKIMIEKLAMSEELGLQHFSGKDQISDATQLKIDLEVDKILNESYKRAIDILRTHRIELNNLAEALVQNETLDGAEVEALIEDTKSKKWNEIKVQQKEKVSVNCYVDLPKSNCSMTGPPEHMETVGICSHSLLANIVSLFPSGSKITPTA